MNIGENVLQLSYSAQLRLKQKPLYSRKALQGLKLILVSLSKAINWNSPWTLKPLKVNKNAIHLSQIGLFSWEEEIWIKSIHEAMGICGVPMAEMTIHEFSLNGFLTLRFAMLFCRNGA